MLIVIFYVMDLGICGNHFRCHSRIVVTVSVRIQRFDDCQDTAVTTGAGQHIKQVSDDGEFGAHLPAGGRSVL